MDIDIFWRRITRSGNSRNVSAERDISGQVFTGDIKGNIIINTTPGITKLHSYEFGEYTTQVSDIIQTTSTGNSISVSSGKELTYPNNEHEHQCEVEHEGGQNPGEEQLWHDVIYKNNFFESQYVTLKGFKLLEWVPRSPGLYYTQNAKTYRQLAEDFRYGPNIYDPYGKTLMLYSGVGCFRLTIKNIDGERMKFLCATSSGIAHKGFLVAMKEQTYRKIGERVKQKGGIICNLLGEIRYWSNDNKSSIPVRSFVGIPRTYILATDVKEKKEAVDKLSVSAGVTFRGKFDGDDGIFFTYSNFDPSAKDSLDRCIEWIKSNYVENMHKGKVLTDFDQEIPHFQDAEFPLTKLMDPQISTDVLERLSNYNV